MNKRLVYILSGLLAIQLFFWAIVHQAGQESARLEKRFFPGLRTEFVQRLLIGDAERKLVLRREGTAWVIDGPAADPIDADKLEIFLGKLGGLRSSHLVARRKDSHARFQLTAAKHDRRIEVEFQDGTRKTLFMGSAPTYRATHVRDAADAEVYLVKDFAAWEAPLEEAAWRKTATEGNGDAAAKGENP